MCNCGSSGGATGAKAAPATKGPLAPGYTSKARTRRAELAAEAAKSQKPAR